MRVWLNLLALGVLTVTSAHADRDIVYAARYYTPPGSHRTSHFHLYRINPNGTGKMQLTFGSGDEDEPQWTADGQHIRFIEHTDSTQPGSLCEINADGSRRHVLKALTNGDLWPPELSVVGYRLDDVDSGSSEVPDKRVLVNLRTGHHLTLRVPHYVDDDLGGSSLLPMPGKSLVYELHEHLAAVGKDNIFYLLNPKTGALRRLGDGYSLAWSPQGSRFCLVPGLNVMPYERRKHPYPVSANADSYERMGDEYRLVWTAPLYIRAAAGGPRKQLTPDLSWVTGADWRHRRIR